MDMFYAACEGKTRTIFSKVRSVLCLIVFLLRFQQELNDPSLKSIPFAVGSNMMLSTTNYEARKYGIRAGQPGFVGKQLARELGNTTLKIVPTNFELYMQIAEDVRSILKTYDPDFDPLGADESFMDLTDCVRARRELPSEAKVVLESPCQERSHH